eukprot:gnl/MRDRNA2_/MRDRNA2_118842_c0_seq1.p1 gnl/MRDRNA2_/MRDRNA2_118842_c0~~gnl/MRDRNA2_/MRDRNA2_118842_c0_seq1.p1  ORF type:complete len:228 (-),score=28.15 gnl/MRDRNA2_/MRDRNA2_118842_c0_seq1:222-821(-)
MGAHHSHPHRTVAEKMKIHAEEWFDHLIETMPSFEGHESDYAFAVLGMIFLYCLLRQCVRKMFGTTRVTFAFHHKVNPGEEIRVVGNARKLGKWDPNRAAPMRLINDPDDPVWMGHLDLNFPLRQPLEYKYVVMTRGTWSHGARFKDWEPCANRVLRDKRATDGDAVILHQYWGGRDKVHDKVPDHVGCNPLSQPLMGA